MWKPKFGWFSSGARANATTPTDDEDELDEVVETDDDDAPPAEETPEPAATATADADLKAENERLKAENARLAARAGETTLEGAKAGALKAAVRLFGQGTEKLKQAKKQIALATTPDEADAFRAAFELAFGTTSIAGLGGVRQAAVAPTPKADEEIAARAQAVAARTRPKGTKEN